MVAYQKKLHQLDGKQQELVKDNFELKDLCLYLDEERNQPAPDANSEKPGTSSQESCIGDKLSCPQCGYGPIWIVSRSEEASDLNDSSSIEHVSPSPAIAPANNANGNSKLYKFLTNGGVIFFPRRHSKITQIF